MEFDEVLHVVEHLVVASSRAIHLLTDGRHVPEDRRVQKRCTRDGIWPEIVADGYLEQEAPLYREEHSASVVLSQCTL